MSRSSGRDFEDAERAMYQVQHRLEGNMHCADCGTPRPEYANLTLGTFICKDCADVHRNMSNRRIKDILGRDLTMDDVRRMDNVGNDVANRKFLATWDPREFPEPKPGDKEALKNFIWLKYDGSWKKAPPPSQQRQNSGRHDRYYGDGADDRGRNAYGRERDLFRDSAFSTHAPLPPQPQRSFWADRVGQASHRPQPQDDFRRSYSNSSSRQDRFRLASSQERQERFHAPVLGYARGPGGGSRYEEPYEEEYERHDRGNRDERGESRRREASGSDQRLKERSRRKKAEAKRYSSEEEENYYSEDAAEEKKKGNRRRGSAAEKKFKSSKSRKKKVVSEEEEESEPYSDDSEESDEDYASRSKKMSKKKKAAKKTSVKREGRKGSNKRTADVSSDESEDDDEDSPPQSPIQKSSRKAKSKSSTTVSLVTNPFEDSERDTLNGNEVAIIKPPAQAKAEFDLMSDWMGGETDATTVQSSSSTQTATIPQQPVVQQPQQQPGMQMPMMAPSMSVYGGMMPQAAAAYMTGIPMMTPQGYMPMGAVPGVTGMPAMGMPGIYGMPGLPQMSGVGAMPNMAGIASVPVMPQMGANGLVSGMQNMRLQPGTQQPPPPPPPAGVSGGHPVGPPPGPPPS